MTSDKQSPRERYLALLETIRQEVEAIDDAAPWSVVEPEWWLLMMKLDAEVRDQKEFINEH